MDQDEIGLRIPIYTEDVKVGNVEGGGPWIFNSYETLTDWEQTLDSGDVICRQFFFY